MKTDNLVVLEQYNTVAEAEIAKTILQSAGIESMIRNSTNFPLAMPPQLVVSEEDLQQARELLHHR